MTCVFVYGSLRRGHPNHHRLGEAHFVARGSIAGSVYDLGKFRGLVRTPRDAGRVSGELHELAGSEPKVRLAALDRFEGREFRRTRVMVRLRSGRRCWAWTYVYAGRVPLGARALPT